MIRKPLANYTAQQTLFTQLLNSETQSNILLFRGESGSGKSHFIDYCLQTAWRKPQVLLQLQSGHESIASLLAALGRQFGWDRLPTFTKTAVSLLEQPLDKATDNLWLMGMHRHLREIGRIGDIDSRLGRYQLLSDAWFADAAQFDTTLLLAIDAYENASTLFDHWFCHDFLPQATQSPTLKIIVGGQTVPDVQTGTHIVTNELAGIHEVEAWVAWTREAEVAPLPPAALDLIVRILKGRPGEIIEAIQAESRRHSSANALETWSYAQRKRLRENMIAAFSLSDLRNICFDMGIEYEDLPNHGQLSDCVRELITLVKRNGRLDELLDVCQSERPHLEWRA